MDITRYITDTVRKDLPEKMVFVGGPRQVGKTRFALAQLDRGDERHPAYMNWDYAQDREAIMRGQLPPGQELVIFDEIHKYARWRNLLKGLYDKNKSAVSFLVTGSARLDYYRKGGDSLQGRYHYYRLHPLSLMEMDSRPGGSHLKQLLRYGGFPEPLLKADSRFHRRWMREHRARVVREDLRDLEQVREVSMIELMLEHLPSCVGSPLSINSLSNKLQVAHATAEHWLAILERLYVCFRIAPFGSKKIRAVRKERKLYFWDWSCIEDPGTRFENLVASQLLKYCHYVEDTEGYNMQLRFIRDTDRREVDFVVLRDNSPLFAVECKSGEQGPSPACRYFRQRTAVPKFYQVHMGNKDFDDADGALRVLPFVRLCKELGMP
jgi:predicted AAA+ superfamily ATPase